MSKNVKRGLEALLRPEDSIVVLIDHQPFQFTNLNSHDPMAIINAAAVLSKEASTVRSITKNKKLGYIERLHM